nr:MAG TPA: hypothetical protein [Bacteriophage sp.]
MKYVICNYNNYSLVETIESDNFIKVEERLKQLNKGYNNELIIISLHRYNKLIKGLQSKINRIKKVLN